MGDSRFNHLPHYSNSRALVIGIDAYENAPPLSCAVSDAEGIRDLLITDLGFAAESVTCLVDGEATRANIMRAYMDYAKPEVDVDERVLVFFAGHGHTESGYRGEVGYLVPYDADMDDLSTFIKWNEITGNAELIPAKHMLFIMDACYSGLAVTRSTPAGSSRFLKDMMLRYSRQVVAAGKADETVSDSGGPLPDHSVFTGHLINGLRGDAANEDGVLTANLLMAYVYGKVANDKNSHQTPHFGHFDGDGDFIFTAPQLKSLESNSEKDLDTLIVIPIPEVRASPETTQSKIVKAKLLISDEASTIALHDFLMEEVRRFLSATSDDYFSTSSEFSLEGLLERISSYEEAVADLSILLACLANWATPSQRAVLQKALARSTDRLEIAGGLTVWINLRWYPMIIELYSAGIAAVHGKRYGTLSDILYAPVGAAPTYRGGRLFASAVARAISELNSQEVFKRLPGHERQYVPLSEYLFKTLQPQLDDLLFMGKDYERAFDEFEILFSLAAADLSHQDHGHAWGPIGRFGWKHRSGESPLTRIVEEAGAAGDDWAPLRNGLFSGSTERLGIATEYLVESVNRLPW